MSPTPEPDRFGAAELRAAVLQAWRGSPTRFTEDANAEEDLRLGGYSDRLFVELAQNAADAAALAGIKGSVRVTVVDRELRVANTGAPLDRAGVAALASLRASAKRGGVTVGRFGVGFAAVLAVSTEPRVVSTTGGIRFSATRTRDTVATMSEVDTQLEQRGGAVPILRLPWPTQGDEPAVPQGFDTEVRLPLNPDVDANAVLAEIAAEIEDVLLTLPVLARIEVDQQVWTRTEPADGLVDIGRAGAGMSRWLVHSDSGEFTAEDAATLGIEAARHPQWTVLWALPVDADGMPLPLPSDVLHAPTATDERLALPARLIATAPIEPSRRRVLDGPAMSAVLRAAAAAYPELVRKVAPEYRLDLVPSAGFPLSEVDAQLHELIVGQLRERAWIAPAAGDQELAGGRARVLQVDSADVVRLLADSVPDLAATPAVGPRAVRVLAEIGASPLSVAVALDALAGVAREPEWWCALYDAVSAMLDARMVSPDELAGLSVPLVDGRTVPGVRGVLLPSFDAAPDRPEGERELLGLLAQADIVGMRVALPAVVHPVLERLGATHVGAGELLDAQELRAAVQRSVDDALSGLDTRPLVDLVLRLVSELGSARDCDRGWLGALALRSADGEPRRADELVLPGSPLLEVFAAGEVGSDGPLAVLDADLAATWPSTTLVAVCVLDSFALVADADPVGPEHDLPDEREWWSGQARPPARVLAVRDLDLVDEDAWPAALRLLAGQPDTWRALAEPDGHAGWWIARYGLLGGAPPRQWRLPDCTELAGLYEPVPELGLRRDVLVAAGVRDGLSVADPGDAADLIDRLADATLRPHPGVVLRAHTRLAELASNPETDLSGLDPPDAVRALDGSVVDAEQASVLDEPWLLEVADHGRLVGCAGGVAALAELFDLPLASEVTSGEVVSSGDVASWSDLAAVRLAADLLGVPVPDGGVCTHAQLTVGVDGARRTARWWVDPDQGIHAEDSVAGLARAFAHAVGRWELRQVIAELLADPEPATLLG
ncbi:MAG: sacsin N-terminal ATP-binding-like domain-containing protein [Haloechinothrix sp.]